MTEFLRYQFDILLLAAALLLLIGVCLFVYRKGKTTAR